MSELDILRGQLVAMSASIARLESLVNQPVGDVQGGALLPDVQPLEGGVPVVYGTPGLFKAPHLLGWKRATVDADWEQMSLEEQVENPPTVLEQDVTTELTCLRWTWDVERVA